ncbi:MAG: dual specificity protein phosphatase family protein [Halobacterium sp.]
MSDSSIGLFVRPYGYAASEPVVAALGTGDAFIGNEAAATAACDRDFAHVLTLTPTPAAATTHHRPLTDDDENDWRAFVDAADTARELLAADGSVLIHCRAGVSRSAAVAAAATAVSTGESFVDALHAVQDARPQAVPRPALHELGVHYVADRQSEKAQGQTATSFSSSPDS